MHNKAIKDVCVISAWGGDQPFGSQRVGEVCSTLLEYDLVVAGDRKLFHVPTGEIEQCNVWYHVLLIQCKVQRPLIGATRCMHGLQFKLLPSLYLHTCIAPPHRPYQSWLNNIQVYNH